MDLPLPEPLWNKHKLPLILGSLLLIFCSFILGQFLISRNVSIQGMIAAKKPVKLDGEVFGFAPYWSLSKMGSIDWDVLTTFAYFSLPVNSNGTISRNSYEWQVFNGSQIAALFKKADDHHVKKVATLTQMDAAQIKTFLADRSAWQQLVDDSVDIVKNKNLNGVNIDFEYIPSNDIMRGEFSEFMDFYSSQLHKRLDNPYITVSVLASSVRFDKIYDISKLAKTTDGIFMMAYDYYYPGSDSIGPSAPLYGYNNGKGPFWYDVSTAVDDFITVADPKKIILGVPYYGWNYPAYNPQPQTQKILGTRASAMTADKISSNKILSTTPVGGWDDTAKVSWRGYWDSSGWHVVYMEDANSLGIKFDFAKSKHLGGVGIWALGYDGSNSGFWALLKEKFSSGNLAYKL